MNGKKFLGYLFLFFFLFTIVLFYTLFSNGWVDTFLKEGFKGLYGE